MITAGRLALSVVVLAASWSAQAEIMTFTPDPSDLNGLDHSWVYSWGFDVPLDGGDFVTAAELTFHDIRNWDDNSNVLYTHLLNRAELGVEQVYDNQLAGDYFATDFSDEHTPLVTYENLPSTPQDVTYTFTADDLAVFNTYLADQRAGIGFDPDCHFYNNGVELTLTVIPEPATVALLGIGALLLLARKR